MAKRVYHWKHGWIPLDHVAAKEKHGGIVPVEAKHLKRNRHILAVHNGGNGHFGIKDTKTGHSTRLSPDQAQTLHDVGHTITAVHEDGSITTRPDSHRAKAVAARLVENAKKHEPRLTRDVKAISDRHGGRLAGLDFRIKTEESLARKLRNEVREAKVPPPLTVEQAAAKMFDVNRYTTVFADRDYSRKTQAALDDLRASGYTLRVKNYWNNTTNPYQGVNVQVTAPDGYKFELQFHTGRSLEIKETELHRLYELQRVETNPEKFDRLTEQMFAVTSQIPVPDGITTVG